MNIDQTIGNRGIDTAFHNLMAISGEAILKLRRNKSQKLSGKISCIERQTTFSGYSGLAG
jgi:hypothetical protein